MYEKVRRTSIKWSRKIFGWPPSAQSFDAKVDFIARIGREYALDVLIETGTFNGEMLERQRKHFKKLTSIELSDGLYQAASKRFESCPSIQLVHGDSGVKLAEVVKDLKEPALFWLDAHYSSGITAGRGTDAPIFKELSALANRSQSDVILIDDARLFGFDFGYPSIKRVKEFVSKHWPDRSFNVEMDIICIASKKRPAPGVNGQGRIA